MSPAGLCPRAPRRQHGGQSIDVRSNDVVFSIHANAATALTLVQICVYQRGDQGVSRWMWAALAASGVAVAGYAAVLAAGAPAFSVLGLLYLLSYIKLAGSAVKYIPQLALNRANASTEGFTIANALTDLGGGVLSMAQQARGRSRAASPAPRSLGAAQQRAAAVRRCWMRWPCATPRWSRATRSSWAWA
jgi:hypothetical protein